MHFDFLQLVCLNLYFNIHELPVYISDVSDADDASAMAKKITISAMSVKSSLSRTVFSLYSHKFILSLHHE